MPTSSEIGNLMDNDILMPNDIDVCKLKRGERNQLLFGVMISYYRKHIRFPAKDDNPIPLELFKQVANELNISLISDLSFEGRTAERYRNEIRSLIGYREAIETDSIKLINYLKEDILPQNLSDELVYEQVRLYFEKEKIEMFKEKQLQRYIKSAKFQFEEHLISAVYNSLTKDQCLLIDEILKEQDKSDTFELNILKKSIPGARLKHVKTAIDKIDQLSKISLPEDISNTNRKLLLKYHNRIMALSPSHIKEFNIKTKYATMAIFCYIQHQVFLDELTDTFIKLVHRLRTNAESYVDKQILKDVKHVDGKFDILEKLAISTAHNPKGVIEETVYPEVSQEKLLDLIDDLRQRGKWYQHQVQTKIHSNYVHANRPIILSILKVLQLKEDHACYKPLLKGINFVNKHWDDSDIPSYTKTPPIEEIIPESWINMVITKYDDKEDIINKYNYELAILEQLKSYLGYKAIWVKQSYRYRNPKDDIPKDFNKNKKAYYRMLNLPMRASTFINKMKRCMENSLKDFNDSIETNSLVAIKQSKTHRNIKVSPSNAQKPPHNIDKLHDEIVRRWESINLIDILKESDLFINFTDQMETIARIKKLDPLEFRKRLLLCLYGIGSNTGLKRISIANGDVKYDDLKYIKNRFVHATNLRNAIREVVNAVMSIRDPKIWGEATTTVACDSTQISAWDQNLINEWHHRYKGKGVMIYWHIDKKALCIYSQLKSCSSSEVGSMLKGVIDHDTKMNMSRVFTDTHGQSVIGFGVSYLLDFDLLPRFKAINKQKICGVTSKDKKKYTNISLAIKGSIDWDIIKNNYNEIVKYMVALRIGLIEPSVLIKRFSKDNYDHPVYKALTQIGRANKSIFLCKYLSSEDLRVDINEGLNVVERLNNIMDFIFYGKLGEMKNNNADEQELSVLCLHLLQACMVYINTLIIQEILAQSHWQGKLTPEDYRALSPLFSGHINPYGLFPMDFNQRLSFYRNNKTKATNDDQAHTRQRKSKTAI